MESSSNKGDNATARHIMLPNKTSSARNGLNVVDQHKRNSVFLCGNFCFVSAFLILLFSCVFDLVCLFFCGFVFCLFLKEKKNIKIGGQTGREGLGGVA